MAVKMRRHRKRQARLAWGVKCLPPSWAFAGSPRLGRAVLELLDEAAAFYRAVEASMAVNAHFRAAFHQINAAGSIGRRGRS